MDRFVAGAHFYNYDMFGSLRAGSDAHLLSRAHAGLAAAAFASAFVYVGLRSGLLNMIGVELAFSTNELQAVNRLAELPAAFAFFVGVVMDAAPLVGFHRKAYMIVGLLLTLASLGLLSAAFCFETTVRSAFAGGYVYVVTLLIGATSVGSMINFVAAHTRVVELSQRESLGDRGILQAQYLVARVSGQATAHISMFAISQVDASLHVPLVMLVLSTVSIGSLAAVILFLDEGEDRRRRSIRTECAMYWTLTQQKAMWRILGFISIYAFALGFKFAQAERAIQAWSRVEATQRHALLSNMAADGVMLGTIVLWRRCCMNSLWRRVFSAGPVVAIVSQLLLLSLTTSGVARNPAFFVFATSLIGVPTALLALSTLVPVTEIAQESSEGGVVGLALSFYTISKVFASTFLSVLQHAAVFAIGEPAVEDSQRVRSLVAAAQVATIVVHALALGGIALLPLQKLDAQQLRMFGGFTRHAAPVAAFMGVGLLLYCVVFNVLLLIPSTAALLAPADASDHGGTTESNDIARSKVSGLDFTKPYTRG